MLVRWLFFLDIYDFDIKHGKGSLHGNADGLSRRSSRRCKRLDCSQCNDTLPNDKDNSREESERQNSAYSMASETVSAVTIKQNQEYENELKLLSSNWLGTDVDIEILQSEDKVIKTIRDLFITSEELLTIVTSEKELDILMK